MRVALVHDWLTGLRGGERVLHELVGLYPEAEIHTLIHVRGSTSARIESRPIHTSPLDRWPGIERHYRMLLPLYPWAIDRLDLRGYDLIVSTSHAVAKSIRRPTGIPHVSYCFTPMRYVWDQRDAYLGRGLRRALAAPLVAGLRRFDVARSGPESVTRFVAISTVVADRIRRCYGREAAVVPPPIDVDWIEPASAPAGPDAPYLVVSSFVPYKRDDLVIEAFRRRPDRRLEVVGDGPGRAALERTAPPNVRFLGRLDDAGLAVRYAACRALIYPQLEDFGLIAVEAQAAGRPVIAYGEGGVLDTVVDVEGGADGATGLHFHRASADGLLDALERFEKLEDRFDPPTLRRHAESFSPGRFTRAFSAEVAAAGCVEVQ